MKALSSKECLDKIVKDFISTRGNPKVSDNTTIFVSEKWRSPLENMSIKKYINVYCVISHRIHLNGVSGIWRRMLEYCLTKIIRIGSKYVPLLRT